MAAAQDFGLRIPDDIAFVGFGGLRWGAHTRPALTTVSLDVDGLADAVGAAFKALAEEGEIPLLTLVPSKLIVRGST
jgi:DNA-binding LacI/PurR family transcriptional regulator